MYLSTQGEWREKRKKKMSATSQIKLIREDRLFYCNAVLCDDVMFW